ncbi:hypothetical protein KUTeg_021689 [Tegillarca granosa]|uniref:G-protein coupled receptors family 1 profile domain-containing protein n=1 Tax=Tegillarca granosa TaxID=220873 RepID=A0ABQ9E4W4_TEGGR|nr:hypothetical protein KUTeg_021689 [Tegillarca granosa]
MALLELVDKFKDTNYQAEFNALLTIVFIVITLILAILYYCIVRDVRLHNKIRWECQMSQSSHKNMSRKLLNRRGRKTTITLFAVTVGYVASALPHHALALFIFIKKDLDCILTFEQDLTNCCINMPLVIFYLHNILTFPSELFCKIFRFVLYYVTLSSEVILVVIATDRYRKICQPLKPQFSHTKTKLFCSLSLLIGILLTWPSTIIYGDFSIVTGIGNITGIRCFTADEFRNTNFQLIFNALPILVFLVVVIALITMYARIISKLKGQITKKPAILSLDSSKKSFSTKRLKIGNATITFLAVTSVFIISALPHHILAMLYFMVDRFECRLSYTESSVYYTFIWIFFVNSCANPFVYGFSDPKFRLVLKQFYCCKGNNNSNQNTSSNDKVIYSDEITTV